MKYYTMVHALDVNIIKEFSSLEELNNYYGFNYTGREKFPDMKENVMGIYAYMIINRYEE